MWLGIDIGTSGVKTVITDDDGKVAAEHIAPLGISRPHPLWSQQDPEDWWAATCASILALPANLRAKVRGMGLSGQMHGAVLLDAADKVLRPAILWNDGRSSEQCIHLDALARQYTGNLAMPGFTAPKLLWLRQHEAEIFAATHKILLPKDYIRMKLTGEKITDMSDASGTIWLDVAARKWSDEMLAATHMTSDNMPILCEGNAVAGQLRKNIAQNLGLNQIYVAGGGGDQAAGAIGAGVINDGDAFLSLGTSGVIFAAGNKFAPNAEQGVHAFCHALPNRWHVMSVMLSAAACLDWGAKLTGFPDVASAIMAAEKSGINDQSPIFLPYLSGERTPHNNADAKGAFFGLTHDVDGGAIMASILQGVAFGLRDGYDALSLNIENLSVIGGGSRSSYWAQILSDALQIPLIYRDGAAIGPAYGAARLARLAIMGENPDDICTMPNEQAQYSPKTEPTERLQKFRAIYRAVEPIFT
ncbi:xylulokinase [Sphingorhabdus lutea]|uniref:Xylulose kinase n=1 Tax=Sphingorhabdus lutea TaxID=1913578 RepID=A0A1L3J9Q6_9SPHN|nr:xylulokinase [Sphingorhabdus lutea]APG61867.1 xylulokinase [Sphingorhabdus lutea]